jgi:hypothetical protein
MFAVRLRHEDRVKEFSITAAKPSGWEVRLEEDAAVRRLTHYHDWHRVERTLGQFRREVTNLQQQGWRPDERDKTQG